MTSLSDVHLMVKSFVKVLTRDSKPNIIDWVHYGFFHSLNASHNEVT
jgi:hypothetical protein